ncbi:MAG: HdeD family acid-resistance protein [Ruminococcus sp.]
MKVFNGIIGVLSILGAVYCMFFPGISFLNTGWIVAILLGIYGINNIFGYFSSSKKENKGDGKLVSNGVMGLIIGIACAVVALLAMFSSGVRGTLDLIILLIFAFWLIYSGAVSIFGAFAQKKMGGKMWGLSLTLGIIVLLTGLYGATHLLFAAFSIGYMIGIELMVYGISLLISAFENKN